MDLVQEFFQRDLSEAEHEALSKLLEQSPEAALSYQRLLEQNYLATGLPQPTLPKGLQNLPHSGGGGLAGNGIFLKLFIIGLATTGVALWKFWPRTNVGIPQGVQPHYIGRLPNKPIEPLALKKLKAVVPFKPVAAGPTQEGQELSVVVNTPQKSLVTVRILDAKGQEVRALYTGFVDPGHWAFKWDGLLQNGEAANAGDYRIDVQSGAAHMTKDIQIKLKPTSN